MPIKQSEHAHTGLRRILIWRQMKTAVWVDPGCVGHMQNYSHPWQIVAKNNTGDILTCCYHLLIRTCSVSHCCIFSNSLLLQPQNANDFKGSKLRIPLLPGELF